MARPQQGGAARPPQRRRPGQGRPPPREGGWREQLAECCHRYRRLLLDNRDAAKVISGRLVPGPCMFDLMEDKLDRLRSTGFSAPTLPTSASSSASNASSTGSRPHSSRRNAADHQARPAVMPPEHCYHDPKVKGRQRMAGA
ncbi:TetR/AcrR family transcriptional regulator C-terminal domain-containing protein [Streptomyces sp. NRRL WC-3742]|uniref:TetR/AcrR family transcriptional regulator C-terminal domain-containing protein n=1 Tax=Streptomyces sp. NRRL WC-3742 TaxID=1463934 RepID=UPI00099BC658